MPYAFGPEPREDYGSPQAVALVLPPLHRNQQPNDAARAANGRVALTVFASGGKAGRAIHTIRYGKTKQGAKGFYGPTLLDRS
jgi:hypothetical protein